MRLALIRGGIVATVTEGDAAYQIAVALQYDQVVDVDAQSDVATGWTYSGGVFTAPAAPATPVPASVTMRQARLALLAAGKLTAVTDAIAALSEPQKTAATIEWEYSNDVEREHGMVVTLAGALGLSGAEIDALFISASTL